MSENGSCQFRSSEGHVVSRAVAIEAQEMVLKAAGNTAGLTIKGQLRKAARALGYADGSWRIKAAWYFEAGSWSAAAFEDLRARYRAFEAQQERLAIEIDKKHAALLRASTTITEAKNAAMGRQEARASDVHARLLEAAAARRQRP